MRFRKFAVTLLHFFRTTFYKSTYGGLLLLDVLASFIASLLSLIDIPLFKKDFDGAFSPPTKYFSLDTLQYFLYW